MDIPGIIKSILMSEHMQTIVLFILANLVVGVVASFRLGDFMLSRLPDFLGRRLIPLGGGYLAAALAASAGPYAAYLESAAYYACLAALLAYIVANLSDLFGVTLPMPIVGKAADVIEDYQTSAPVPPLRR